MKQKYVIGIDVSKSKLDIAILNNQLELLQERVILNNSKSIRAFIKAVLNTYRITRGEVLICCENTGIYNRPLEVVCSELDVLLWVEHALKIKWATTDMRGKDDRKDALRIAQYAIRYNDKLIPYREATEVIKQLNILTKAREAILGQKTALENRLKEAKTHDVFEYQILSKSFKKVLNALVKSIKQTEEKIEQLIANAPEISQTKALITTIPGIGPQCAVNLIIATNNF
ncbi:IS110 family transposase, partial [Flavobacterium akiainvivens]